MRLFSKDTVAETLASIRTGFRHAFATQPDVPPLSPADAALMERVAAAIVKRGMAAPAMVFLESMGPMNYLGSQALHVLAPIIECAIPPKDVEQVARLLERRDTIPRLIAIIDAMAGSNGTSPS